MNFFDTIDTVSVLERNANKVEGIELNSARKLLKQYKKAKKELSSDMLLAHDNSYTEAKMKATIIQLDRTIRQLEVMIKPQLKTFFDDMSVFGVEDSVKEVSALEKKFNGVIVPMDIDSIVRTSEPDNFLFNNFESSITTYNQTLRNGFQRQLTQSLLQQKSWSQTVFDMEQVFNESEFVLARIVRTELHSIYSGSKLNGFLSIQDQYLPDLKKTLYHPMDSRTGEDSKQASRLHLIVGLNEPFKYKYNGKERVFMFPPDRPNDRSILIPYRESWKK